MIIDQARVSMDIRTKLSGLSGLKQLDVIKCFLKWSLSCVNAEEKEVYRGKYLGKINSYHHQVSGDVYAVDEYTFLFINFNYDGNGADTFFWAGATNRPGPQGFIIPDEFGKTNMLERYFNKDFTLTLPDGKKITEIKWIAIYDLSSQNTFGDVYIPEEFEPPTTQTVSQLTGKSHNPHKNSLPNCVQLHKDLQVGWEIFGPQITIQLAGQVAEDNYMAFGLSGSTDKSEMVGSDATIAYLDGYLGYALDYNITAKAPSPGVDKSNLVVCSNWSLLVSTSPTLLFAPIGVSWCRQVQPCCLLQLESPGVDKSNLVVCSNWSLLVSTSSTLLFAPIGVSWCRQVQPCCLLQLESPGHSSLDSSGGGLQNVHLCVKVLGQYKGVCKDMLLGGFDSNQLHTAVRENGINIITYRRTLISADPGDQEYRTQGWSYVVWAVGKLNHNKEPMFHDMYPKWNLKLELNRKEQSSDCFAFTRSKESFRETWEAGEIFDRTIRTFTATLGPSGGRRGYQGITGMTTTGLVWYINGLLAPEIWLRRGLTYSFKIHGGNNPHSAEYYHPFIITDEAHGGFDMLSEEVQQKVRVLAGVEFTRRGQPKPTAAGPLCISKHNDKDRRLDDDYPTFKKFNHVVYYNSFTHPNMGWKIHVVDSYARTSAGVSMGLHVRTLLLTLCATLTSYH
uniref:DM13 domain-containing protein n=1 Tax=Timema douglasi TaxID=61478 RepID=A0A7R8VR27_TIMDO|nr:unnamed protein product [Timema douglasi]